MPAQLGSPAREPAGFTPQMLLIEHLGWKPASGAGRRVRIAGATYPFRAVAEREGFVALLYDVPFGGELPHYAERRALRRAVIRGQLAALLVFRHPLHACAIWQWTEPAAGRASIYREHCIFREDTSAELAARLRRLIAAPVPAAETAETAEHGALRRAVAAAIGPALLRRVRRRHAPALRDDDPAMRTLRERAPCAFLQAMIEASAEPAALRACWHALTGLRVLDVRCGRGDRLLATLEVLEVLYDACLERMRIWVDELARSRAAARPEKLADFRAALARADDRRRHAARHRFIRSSILRDNLYGVEPDTRRLRDCRQRLRAAAGGGDFLHPGVQDPGVEPVLNLYAGDVDAGFRTVAELQHALAGEPDAADLALRLLESAETIDRTRWLLRQQQLLADGDAVGFPLPDPGLAARGAALHRALTGWKAAEHGVRRDDARAVQRWGRMHRPLHLLAECYGIMQSGDFDVTFGAEPAAGSGRVPERRRYRDASRRPSAPGGAGQVREAAAAVVGSRFRPSTPLPCSPLMADTRTRLDLQATGYPAALRARLGSEAPAALMLRGNPALLELPLLAIFASIRAPGTVILHTLDLMHRLRDMGVATLGGFQSPLEKECLGLLLRGRQPVVVSPARGLEPMRLPKAWQAGLGDGRLLLVSRFAERQRRPTTRMAEARNRLVGALAARAFIAHATPGGRTYHLARWLSTWGVPLLTLDDPANADLLRMGARPVASAAAFLEPA